MSKKVIRAGYLKIVKFELLRNLEVAKITVNGNEANDLFLWSKIKTEARVARCCNIYLLKQNLNLSNPGLATLCV